MRLGGLVAAELGCTADIGVCALVEPGLYVLHDDSSQRSWGVAGRVDRRERVGWCTPGSVDDTEWLGLVGSQTDSVGVG